MPSRSFLAGYDRHFAGNGGGQGTFRVYVASERRDSGFGVALSTLFLEFLGPWGWHDLGEFLTLVGR